MLCIECGRNLINSHGCNDCKTDHLLQMNNELQEKNSFLLFDKCILFILNYIHSFK